MRKKFGARGYFPSQFGFDLRRRLCFEPRFHYSLCFGQVVRFDFASLVAEVEAVGGDFEEEDLLRLPREFFVEQEDARLDARLRLEDTGRE
jgi:hypothetical protein